MGRREHPPSANSSEGRKMTADKIVNMLLDMKHEAIQQKNFTEHELLGPSQAVLDAIQDAGGKIGTYRWEKWCHSDHNSHSPGQGYQTVLIPDSWILKDANLSELSKIFIIDDDENFTPRLIVPTEHPEFVYEISEEHYAVRTSITGLRSVEEYYAALAEQFGDTNEKE